MLKSCDIRVISSIVSRRQECKRWLSSVQDVPVVIVGGGPSGLMMSNLLSSYSTPSVLLEAQTTESRFQHPQAHFLNTRTMEIMRHELPRLYDRVREAMTDIESWRYFQFGYSCTTGIMARVVHPLDRPLDAFDDANGELLPAERIHASSSGESSTPLSPCTVGHLAQHTFCRILWEQAHQIASKGTQVRYQSEVTSVRKAEDGRYTVSTSDGLVFSTPIVVAADGSNSWLRRSWGIGWEGEEGIQSLINIHFTTSVEASKRLAPAMLYSVFTPKVVGMMVCHSPGEYVLQVPYFPPYQTEEDDFGPVKVREIVESALGFSDDSLTIKSVRSWVMSSMVASRFALVEEASGGVLVGDAAHVFPPAGGFGMNTGLQDAHNLAWRIALGHHTGRPCGSYLMEYGQERRPIAQQNAALSVRNFHRVLNVTNACYLNKQHPDLLLKTLEQSSSLLPLSTRRGIFQSLLSVAMAPLSALADPANPYAQLVKQNIRTVLHKGDGLPLLFPELELGFVYGKSVSPASWQEDTKPHKIVPPVVGGRLPHYEFYLVSPPDRHRNLRLLGDGTVSLCDLPAQVRMGDLPCFVVLTTHDYQVKEAIKEVQARTLLGIVHVHVLEDEKSSSNADVVLLDRRKQWRELDPEVPIVLIRPDGHIAARISTENAAIADILVGAINDSLGEP